MLTEQTHTEPNWKLLPGTILDGGYEMQELLDADERRARFKIRVLGDRTIDAFASFFPLGGTAAQDQIEAWELLRRVPHPDVSKPFAAGRRELDGTEVIYVVLRKPDETLNGVLVERALTKEEASEVLLHGARALEHLGRHGLVHGAVSPEQILAVGDSIQFSAEGVRKADSAAGTAQLKARYVAPEGANGNATIPAAIWCLGATVFETLTQTNCGEGCREQAKQLPLGWVLQRCLEPEPNERCKAEEIPVLVKSGPPPVVAPPPVVSPVPATAAAAREAGLPAEELKASGAVAAAGAASGSTPAVANPPTAPAKPTIPEIETIKPAVSPAKPAASSVSQARTKAFQQAEFDALTAPKTVPAGRPNATASAALNASLASPVLGAAQGAAANSAPVSGASVRGGVTGNRAYTPTSLGADSARRAGRTTFWR